MGHSIRTLSGRGKDSKVYTTMRSTALIMIALVMAVVAIPTGLSPDVIISETEVTDTEGDLPSEAGAMLAGQAISKMEPDDAILGDSPLPSTQGGEDASHYEISSVASHSLTGTSADSSTPSLGYPFDSSSNNNKGTKPRNDKTSHIKAKPIKGDGGHAADGRSASNNNNGTKPRNDKTSHIKAKPIKGDGGHAADGRSTVFSTPGTSKAAAAHAAQTATQIAGFTMKKAPTGPLVCNIGTYHVNNGKLTNKVKNGCDDTSNEIAIFSRNHTVVCTRGTHSCMSAAFACHPPTIIAFGCFPTANIKETQEAIDNKCANDKECDYANDDGSPQGGYSVCDTDKCNACNSASGLAPTFLVGLLCVVASMLNTA